MVNVDGTRGMVRGVLSPPNEPKNMIPPHLRAMKEEWEEEFESKITYNNPCFVDGYYDIVGKKLGDLTKKYLGKIIVKVRIKARKGTIQIEKIK